MQTLIKSRVDRANIKGALPTIDFNCWGATLFVLGQSDTLEWVDSWHMINWLCRETKPIKKATSLGDILVISDHSLEHTATYIGRGLWFHKRGSNKAEILSMAEVLEIYPGRYEFRRLKV